MILPGKVIPETSISVGEMVKIEDDLLPATNQIP